MMRFSEETGAALDSVTFPVFGAVLLGPVFEHVSWQIALYTLLAGACGDRNFASCGPF